MIDAFNQTNHSIETRSFIKQQLVSIALVLIISVLTLLGVALMIVIMVGLSLRSLGEPAGILWLVPILILVFLSLYLVAYFGQKLGHKQMTSLHRFIERCVGNEIEAD